MESILRLAELRRSRRKTLAVFGHFGIIYHMEYPPLLEPGFYDLPLDGLKEALWEQFVEPFENPNHRKYLTECLLELVNEFHKIGIFLEIWVDGSFTTEKPVPEDIDMVVYYHWDDRDALSEESRQTFEKLYDYRKTRLNYECDIYFESIGQQASLKYWTNLFGHSRFGTPKGIVRITIPKE